MSGSCVRDDTEQAGSKYFNNIRKEGGGMKGKSCKTAGNHIMLSPRKKGDVGNACASVKE